MKPNIVCFGETLWDIFPDKKVVGGAPLNVALRLHSLGANVHIISSIGEDSEGTNLIRFLDEKKVSTNGIQRDVNHPTGNVLVHLDKNNTATYTISEPVAWDHIYHRQSDTLRISESDAFIFGSLACRNSTTRATLLKYIEEATFSVFDANLRAPFYQMESIIKFMHQADLIKLNDEELDEIFHFLNVSVKGMKAQIRYLSSVTKTDHICVTLGSEGALLFTDSMFYRNKGYKVKVEDTVGAGDSFLASLIYKTLTKVEPQSALDFSCAMGSIVASKAGATAMVDNAEIELLQLLDS